MGIFPHARHFLHTRILLLDEITANLDADTEQTVLSALNRAGNGRTVLSISHRLYEKNGGRQIAI